MSAKIFELKNFRSGFRAPNGVVFPELYRVEGLEWEMDGRKVVASNRPGTPELVLSELDDGGLADPRWTPVKRLDPTRDKGWVIIRRHMQGDMVEGYLDAMNDLGAITTAGRSIVYQSKDGLFTLLRRPAPVNCPDNLLIYCTKEPVRSGPYAGVLVDSWQIVHPDGTVTDDFDAVMPLDEEE